MKTTRTEPRIHTTEEAACDAAYRFNACTVKNRRDLRVCVEGPEGSGHWWTMDLRDAIDNGFAYSWSAPVRRAA